MARKKDHFKRVELLRQNRHGELANAIGTIAACLATILGTFMLILAFTRGSKCKMRVIDASSWANGDLDGNLVKWFKYTGILLITRADLRLLFFTLISKLDNFSNYEVFKGTQI